MTRTVLNVEGIGKCYSEYRSNLARFASWFGVPVHPVSQRWAVRDVNFGLRAGEALALVGQNGAGKSTLLKLIVGTVRPSTGQIAVGGSIGAILELGLGFNPELTGRQNVYQAGGLLGLSHRMLSSLMPGIEDFAELGDYFEQPLRVYSSGMHARLAFSLATAVKPDVLIVDEVLAVGDGYFQHKSFDRIRRFKEEGTAILYVTHNMGDVRALCDRVLLLNEGSVVRDGPADEVVDFYNAMLAEKENAKLSIEQMRRKGGWVYTEFGNHLAKVESTDLYRPGSMEPLRAVRTGEDVEVRSRVLVEADIERLVLGHRITDRTGHVVWGTNTWHTRQVVERPRAGQIIQMKLKFTCALGPGSYAISFGLHRDETHLAECYHKADNRIVFDVINADHPYFIGTAHLNAAFELERVS